MAADRRGFCRELWWSWSPAWAFAEADFERTAEAFNNPDFIDTVIHFYRHSAGQVPGHPDYDELERRAAAVSSLVVPTVVLHGADDGCTLPAASVGQEGFFRGPYTREVLRGAGHFLPREVRPKWCGP